MEFLLIVPSIILFVLVVFYAKSNGKLLQQLKTITADQELLQSQIQLLDTCLANEKENNSKILSQKKSSETRLGQIAENLVPMLQLPYNSKNLHHLAQPIDYIYFDYETPEIVFIEVKSGNARESYRQKLLKKAIQLGKIHYEKLTINDKGIKIKRETNLQ